MLNKIHEIYTLPGWAFNANIFSTLNCQQLKFIGLDYINLPTLSSLSSIAECLADQLPDKINLLGWSLGGLLAIKIASLFPEKVNKLILLATQPKFVADKDWFGITDDDANAFQQAWDNDPRQHINYFTRLVSYPSKLRLEHRVENTLSIIDKLSPLLNLLFHSDLRQEYCHLAIDILHVIGRQDKVLPQNLTQLQQLNSRVQGEVIANAGHAGFLAHPQSYTDAIERFLHVI